MSDRAEVLEHLRNDGKFLLTTHENPDGDALGSLTAMHAVLTALGHESLMFMPSSQFPLPHEYRNLLDAEKVANDPPADLAERTVVYLDCGSFERMDVPELKSGGRLLINIDHHHDNTCFGALNVVEAERSSTAELVWSIAKELGVAITRQTAEALYVGLVTDTGRFMYQNTGPQAHQMAAELLTAGVDVHAANVRLYEDQPVAKIKLLARALSSLEQFDDGALAVVNLTAEDFAETAAEESFTEGIVDFARSIRGTLVGLMYRELTGDDGRRAKLSLRSSADRIDVSAIARSFGGGGHRQAAGATTQLSLGEVVEQVRSAIVEQLDADAG